MQTYGKILLSGFALATLAACSHPLSDLKKEVESYNYAFVNPPRDNQGPGWTFVLSKTTDNRIVPVTVCSDLYPGLGETKTDLSFAETKKTSTVKVDFAIDLVKDLLGSPVSAKASFSDQDEVDIKWGNVRKLEYPLADLVGSQGFRRVDTECLKFIKRAQKKRENEDNIFIAISALEVDELVYTFKTQNGVELSADINLKDALTASTNPSVKKQSTTSLVITDPRLIGLNVFKYSDLISNNQVSAKYKLKGQFVPIHDLKQLLD